MEEENGKGEVDLLIGMAFLKGDSSFIKSTGAAKVFLTRAAEDGDGEAMYQLAKLLSDEREYETAFKWALSAAELGNPQAMRLAASMLGAGIGCNVDEQKCAEWFINSGGFDHDYHDDNDFKTKYLD